MQIQIDNTLLNDPAKNVEYDQYLLENAKKSELVLRLWEPQQCYVVLGKSNRADQEVHVDRCYQDQIPIIKRCSGGGTVLNDKGMLNFAIVGPQQQPFKSIHQCNVGMSTYIKNALQSKNIPLEIKGTSDITFMGKKCVGNAQKRTLNFYLFHGCILFDTDISKISYYLKHPSKEPAYRQKKSHKDFLCNISYSKAELIMFLKNAITSIHNAYKQESNFK